MTAERDQVAALLDRLFAERGLAGAVRFGTQQEGLLLPGIGGGPPIEALSGFALAPDGTVYRFWLDWDSGAGRHLLRPLEPMASLGVLADDPEYLAARRRLGLP
ncbi:MAG: hypothetical protein RMM58_10075 [Chloroflexota bacterium]|nr:hypothetical protein [Dehalococcoidia bacterium]MDW8254213.1 hypothetical protein [Chloroflexota bacterium]